VRIVTSMKVLNRDKGPYCILLIGIPSYACPKGQKGRPK